MVETIQEKFSPQDVNDYQPQSTVYQRDAMLELQGSVNCRQGVHPRSDGAKHEETLPIKKVIHILHNLITGVIRYSET